LQDSSFTAEEKAFYHPTIREPSEDSEATWFNPAARAEARAKNWHNAASEIGDKHIAM
jgi:hypothetical protein